MGFDDPTGLSVTLSPDSREVPVIDSVGKEPTAWTRKVLRHPPLLPHLLGEPEVASCHRGMQLVLTVSALRLPLFFLPLTNTRVRLVDTHPGSLVA